MTARTTVVLLLLAAFAYSGSAHELERFHYGDVVPLQCWQDGSWTDGPTCTETGKPLEIKYGLETMLYCGMSIESQADYDRMVKLLKLESTMHCRVPMSADRSFFIPFTMTMWGVVEADHFHVNNHFSFVFHVDSGLIIGAAAYPVRDRFQLIRPGLKMNIHGPLRWFRRHSHELLSKTGSTGADIDIMPIVLSGVLMSFILSAAIFSIVYLLCLKPRITKKFLKKE